MQQLETHISRINSKLQELLKRHAFLVKESEHQKITIEKLVQENEQMEAKIKMMEQQHHILKSAAGKMNEPDKKEFEQVINKYIREIDKCINLLND
jgi:predicted transcriptional regulator